MLLSLRYQPLSPSSDIISYLFDLLMNKKFMTCYMENLFPMLKHYIENLIRKYFQECLSQTFTKSTWANLVRNILTIHYMPVIKHLFTGA